LREGASFAERRGIEEFVLSLATGILEALVDLGSHEEALALAATLVPRLDGVQDVFDLIVARSSQARVLTRRGEHALASALAEWATGRARELADPQAIAQAFPTCAATRLSTGDSRGAAALLREFDATIDVRDTPNYPRSLPDAARIAIAAEDMGLAASLAEGLEARYRMHDHALLSVRALLAEQRGDHAEARHLYAEAAERWEGFEMPWEEAQALLGQGRCSLALKRRTESLDVLGRARDILVSLGAKPSVAETDKLIARSTALSS
jgi:hypothetical protein